MQQTCNLKCKVRAGTGVLTKVLRKNLEAITGKHSIDSLQDSYTWNTTHDTQSTYNSLKLEA
jgi:hypothetical protein